MPEYKPPRHGVSLSEALLQAAAYAPVQRAMLDTFELWHPLGTSDGPIYVVNDHADLTATKEADAMRDGSLEVLFMRSSLEVSRPEQSDTAAAREISITVANVSGVMSDALRRARGSLVPWELVHRVYASDDTSGPATLPPLSLFLTSVDLGPEIATFTASYGDPANVSVPRITFKRSSYSGLIR